MTAHDVINRLACLCRRSVRRKPKHDVAVKTGLNDASGLQFPSGDILSHGAHADDGIQTPCANAFFLQMQAVAFELDVQMNAPAGGPMLQDIVKSIWAAWNDQGNVV